MAIEGQSHRPFADLVRDSIDEERVERIVTAIEAGRRAPRARPAARLIPVAVAAGLVLAVVLFVALFDLGGREEPSPSSPGPVAVVGRGELREIEATAEGVETRRFELDDGSTVDLDRGTTVTAVENSGQRVALRLGRGRATFDIVPGGPRRWSVDADLATVEVLGTEFTVERSEDRVRASVRRGRVRVVSELLEGGSRELGAGASLVVERREQRPEPLPDASDGGAAAGGTDGDAAAGPVARPSWQRLAGDGQYGAAYELLGGEGIRRRSLRAGTMAELLSLADVARFSGHPGDAVEPLERAIERYATDRRAAVAAFTLGRVEADSLRRHGRAARAFERCIQLGAPRALREDAYARLAEVRAQSGDYAAARRAAREYLRQFPDGQRAEELRQWIQPR